MVCSALRAPCLENTPLARVCLRHQICDQFNGYFHGGFPKISLPKFKFSLRRASNSRVRGGFANIGNSRTNFTTGQANPVGADTTWCQVRTRWSLEAHDTTSPSMTLRPTYLVSVKEFGVGDVPAHRRRCFEAIRLTFDADLVRVGVVRLQPRRCICSSTQVGTLRASAAART
jgi:hypothetical protein